MVLRSYNPSIKICQNKEKQSTQLRLNYCLKSSSHLSNLRFTCWRGTLFMEDPTDYGHPMKGKIKETLKFGPMWETKYAATIPNNLGVGVNFRPCSEGYFALWRP